MLNISGAGRGPRFLCYTNEVLRLVRISRPVLQMEDTLRGISYCICRNCELIDFFLNSQRFGLPTRCPSLVQYENQVVMGTGNWTTKGLPRPDFSDADGILSLRKIYFDCPAGWYWVDEWHTAPDFSSIVGEDFGLNSYTDAVYEVQTIEAGEDWSLPELFWMNSVSDLETVEMPKPGVYRCTPPRG